MSGSQFPPAQAGVVDLGNAPEIFVDGLAHYSEHDGIVRHVFYASKPILEPGAEPAAECAEVRTIVLTLVCSIECQRHMRRQILAVTEPAPVKEAAIRLIS